MASLRQLEKPEFRPTQACTLMARTQINLYLEILGEVQFAPLGSC